MLINKIPQNPSLIHLSSITENNTPNIANEPYIIFKFSEVLYNVILDISSVLKKKIIVLNEYAIIK